MEGASKRAASSAKSQQPGGRPTRPKLELAIQSNAPATSSDTEDAGNVLLMLDKLRRAKQLLAESQERKRRKEILQETLQQFQKESTSTMQKYLRLCQDKKKQMIFDGEKLKADIVSLLENLDRKLESYDKFVTTQGVRVEEAERQVHSFEQKLRRDLSDMDRTLESEMELVRSQIEDKLEEVRRAMNRTAKKAKKKDQYLALLRQILED